MKKKTVKKDDSLNFYKRFMASDVKNKEKLNEEILYQLYKRVVPERKGKAPTISNPPDHKPNIIHQADILYMPNDNGYLYGLTVVDTGSRLTDVEPLKDKSAKSVLEAIKRIYKRGIIKEPALSIEVDNGSEFKKEFKKYFDDKDIYIRVAQTGRSRQQGLVENRNGVIAKTLMRRMVAQELLTNIKSVEWIDYLPKLIELMNKSYYLKPIKLSAKKIMADTLQSYNKKGKEEIIDIIPEGTIVRYQLDKPENPLTGKREHGGFREGDIRWSRNTHKILRYQLIPNQPVMYKIEGKNPLYTREQLQIIPDNSRLPPPSVQIKFIIDKIIDKKIEKRKTYYLIRWKGYTPDDDTWEPKEEIMNADEKMVEDFEKSFKKK